MRQREQQPGSWSFLGILAFLVPLLAACGATATATMSPSSGQAPAVAATTTAWPTPGLTTSPSTAATSTATPAAAPGATAAPGGGTPAALAPVPAPSVAPASSGGTVRAVPVDGFALSGQERVGASGLGAFLFFDADG